MGPRGVRGRGGVMVLLVSLVVAGCGTGTTPSTSTSSTTSSTTSAPTPPPSIAPYLALWPFRTPAEVQAWQRAYASDGSDAWHLSPSATALRVSADYLGFHGIDAVIGTTSDATGAHVAVGFHPTPSSSVTSATVHLVHWGTGATAPWEVVGTDDTTLSLTAPAYGATASSPLRVGGHITGVDESISVEVRQPSSSSALGSYCCTAAGGTGSPWSATVSYGGATDPVLTVVAATGGHVQAVERFAVTGIRSGGS